MKFKEELFKIKNLLKKNQYSKQLIETKINKFLEDYKVDNITFNLIRIKQSKAKLSQIKKIKTNFISRHFT